MKILQLGLSKPGLPPFLYNNDTLLRNRGSALTGDGEGRTTPDGSDEVESEVEAGITTITKLTETDVFRLEGCNATGSPTLMLPENRRQNNNQDVELSQWITTLCSITGRNATNSNEIVETKLEAELYALDQIRKPGVLEYLVEKSALSTGKLSEALRVAYSCADADTVAVPKAPLVGYWLHECLTSHPECQTGHIIEPAESNGSFPTRLIDLGELSGSGVKIVMTNGHKVPYLALSYRWPSSMSSICVLLSDNSEQFTKGISLDMVIPTVQDACVLTKSLGLRYLWVDALCIMQDEGGDWHREATKMASIYMNAVATIAFVDGCRLRVALEHRPLISNADRLKIKLKELLQADEDLSEPGGRLQEAIYEALLATDNFPFRPDGELDHRAWAFQEKLLSTRVISITSTGIFWDCLHHSASDRRPLGFLGDFSPKFRDRDDRTLKQLLLNPSQPLVRPSTTECHWLWRQAVQEYTSRHLTDGRDRFIALDGITRQMRCVFGDECYLGIWRKEAIRLLLWFVDWAVSNQRTASSGQLLAPSWSWIQKTHPIGYRLWQPYDQHINQKTEQFIELANIHKLTAERLSPVRVDHFVGLLDTEGSYVDAILSDQSIAFQRPSPQLYIHKDRERGRRFFSQHRDDKEISKELFQDAPRGYIRGGWRSATLDPAGGNLSYEHNDIFHTATLLQDSRLSIGKPKIVQVLLLGKGGYSEMLTAQYCLVLERSRSTGRHFRIGSK